MYRPLGFTDGEDCAGNRIDGGWRDDEDPCCGLVSLIQTSSNRFGDRISELRATNMTVCLVF